MKNKLVLKQELLGNLLSFEKAKRRHANKQQAICFTLHTGFFSATVQRITYVLIVPLLICSCFFCYSRIR